MGYVTLRDNPENVLANRYPFCIANIGTTATPRYPPSSPGSALAVQHPIVLIVPASEIAVRALEKVDCGVGRKRSRHCSTALPFDHEQHAKDLGSAMVLRICVSWQAYHIQDKDDGATLLRRQWASGDGGGWWLTSCTTSIDLVGSDESLESGNSNSAALTRQAGARSPC